MAFRRGFEFIARIAAIGEDMARPGEPESNGFENIDCAIAVLNSGGVDQDEQQKTAGVGDDMPLVAPDLLVTFLPAS